LSQSFQHSFSRFLSWWYRIWNTTFIIAQIGRKYKKKAREKIMNYVNFM